MGIEKITGSAGKKIDDLANYFATGKTKKIKFDNFILGHGTQTPAVGANLQGPSLWGNNGYGFASNSTLGAGI